jgi:putative transposase
MKRLRAEGRRALDEKLIFSSVLEQRKILEASRKTVHQRRRSEQLKQTEKSTSRSQATARGPEAEQDYSHLPPFKVEEWT